MEDILNQELTQKTEIGEKYQVEMKASLYKIEKKNKYDIYYYKSILQNKKIYSIRDINEYIYIFYDITENIDDILNIEEEKNNFLSPNKNSSKTTDEIISEIFKKDYNPAINLNIEDEKFPSGIIKNIIKESEEIEIVLNEINSKFPVSNYKLLFKASINGDSAEVFHKMCDHAKKSLVLVKDDSGNRFGGFTTKDWGGEYLQKKDEEAFIFSIDKKKIYYIIPGQNAIGCYPNFGPVFFGCQIRIYDNFFTKGGTTFKKGLNYYTTEDFELTNGNQNFGIEDLEIYEVET